MRKYFTWKYIKWAMIACLAYMLISTIRSGNKEEAEKNKATDELIDRHCKTEWSKLNSSQKTKILEEFETNYFDISKPNIDKSVGAAAYQLLTASTKYPETILIDGSKPESIIYFSKGDAEIKNVDKGIVEFSKNYTAENKLSMVVKGTLYLKVQYQAGCKGYKILDFKTY